MDLLRGNIRSLYFKYLAAAFGSTLIMSIYALVDTIVIGHYEGPNGTAAVATFMPMWTMLFAFGLLCGIGGSVIMAQRRGAGDKQTSDQYYTVGMLCAVIISAILFLLYNFCSETLLYLFGARDEVLNLAMKYAFWIALFSPTFVLGQTLIPFIRNDNHPAYTTVSVIAGGCFNIFGDIFFVYGCDMGIAGAGLATALGQAIAFIVLIAYLFSSKCTLHFTRLRRIHLLSKAKKIIVMGGSNFIIDIAMGVLTVIFNNQVMLYFGTSALAVYGVVSTISATVQTFGYAVGESAQAIISVNYGAGKTNRVKATFRYAAMTAFVIGTLCCLLGEAFPILLTKIYMTPTPEVLEIAPAILRKYCIAFLFLVFNVYSTYYFQSVNRPAVSLIISLLRGIVISAALIYILPLVFGANAMWYAIPLTELMVLGYVSRNLRKKRQL
ncbi:MAG: multidrug transporter MatE [Clostridia bacterium]|nr:multidrug transporter MatE [Clostridia bacterium]